MVFVPVDPCIVDGLESTGQLIGFGLHPQKLQHSASQEDGDEKNSDKLCGTRKRTTKQNAKTDSDKVDSRLSLATKSSNLTVTDLPGCSLERFDGSKAGR